MFFHRIYEPVARSTCIFRGHRSRRNRDAPTRRHFTTSRDREAEVPERLLAARLVHRPVGEPLRAEEHALLPPATREAHETVGRVRLHLVPSYRFLGHVDNGTPWETSVIALHPDAIAPPPNIPIADDLRGTGNGAGIGKAVPPTPTPTPAPERGRVGPASPAPPF